jgi:hypothetical protein
MLPRIVAMAEAGSGIDLISRALGMGAEVVRAALHLHQNWKAAARPGRWPSPPTSPARPVVRAEGSADRSRGRPSTKGRGGFRPAGPGDEGQPWNRRPCLRLRHPRRVRCRGESGSNAHTSAQRVAAGGTCTQCCQVG